MRLLPFLLLLPLGLAVPASIPAAEVVPVDDAWDWDHPDRSEARFQDLLAHAGGDVPRQAELLTQVARAQNLQGHYAQAHASLDRAKALQPQAGPRAQVRWMLESGRVAWQEQHVPAALAWWHEAAQAAQAGHWDVLQVDALHMLALVDTAHSLDDTQQALQVIAASTDARARGFYGPLCHNLAMTLQEQGKDAEALAWHQRDLAWRVQRHAPAAERRVAALGIATATRGLGRAADALTQVMAILADAQAEAAPDPWEIGSLEQEQGECLLALGRTAAALQVLTQAQRRLAPLFDPSDTAQKRALEQAIARASKAVPAAP